MLKNTLILPETDARLAADLLEDAVATLDVVLMLVLGKTDREAEIVKAADQLCNKTQTADGNLRQVIWIRRLDTVSMRDALGALLGPGGLPNVAVLNFHDEVKARISSTDDVRPLNLELAFVKGHQV